MILVTIGTGAVVASPVSAAQTTQERTGHGTAYYTTGKTVTLLTESPGNYTTYLVQTDNKGREIVYVAVVEGGGDGSVPGTAEIQLRWTLCSHPATLTIVQRETDGIDEFGEPIYRYVTTYTDPHFTGGWFVNDDGSAGDPACARDRT
jgi:hypothetical protein